MTSSVLPDFDIRLEMDTMKSFYSQSNVGVKLLVSGDLYHNAMPSGAEVSYTFINDLMLSFHRLKVY